MKNRLTGSIILATASFAGAADTQRPNIIYINADDLGVMDVHFDGRAEYRTPNLDKLAAAGMVFTDAYAPAANCAPSRACCISGQYTPRHGIYTVDSSARGKSFLRKLIPIKNNTTLPDKNITIAEALKAAGYATIHLGKWHLGDDPCTQGFDINIGGDHSGSPHGGYFVPFKKGSMVKYNNQYPKGTHRADIFADQASKFIKSHKDKPFFMYMAYYSVHGGWEPVPEYIGNFKNMPKLQATYASMIEKMDESIGKILKTLDEEGLRDNTLVLFTSDNGGVYHVSKQTPYRAGKGSYFEGGVRVPLCVRWPGHIKPGTKCSVPVIGIDFYPTFLAAANVPPPKGKILDGVNLMPLLTGTGSIKDRAIYWHFPIYLEGNNDSNDRWFRTRPGSAMRYGKWKFHEYFEDGNLQLYNLHDDIGERHNLAKQMPEKTAQLLAMLKTWQQSVKAPIPTKLNPDYDPKRATQTGHKKKHKKKHHRAKQ